MTVNPENGIRIILTNPEDLDDPFNDETEWPRLSCGQANQLSLEFGDLKLDDQREIVFQDNGQLRSFDNNHKLVFDRANNLLELQELGDIRFLTGGPAPSEKLRIGADGNVGIGTATPSQKLEVNGAIAATTLSVTDTITANAFEGNGSALIGKVSTAGDTMTGSLTINADLTVNGAIATKQLSASGNGGVEDNIEVTGTIDGRDISTDGATLDSHVTNRGNPHGVTAVQIGALSSIDGVSNPGGNINLTQRNAITISPNNTTNQITIGENHSNRRNNPHGVTANQIGALRTTGGSLTGSLTVRQRVLLTTSGGNGGFLETKTRNNRPAVRLTTAGNGNSGYLSVYNSASNVRVKITTNADDSGDLETKTRSNRSAVRLSTLSNGNEGFLAVYNSNGQQATYLYGSGTKNFVMTHPEDESKDIIYAAIEGPEAAAYIRGKSKLANGRAEVRFPEHFRLVVNPDTMTIQLTPCSADSKGLAVIEQSELGFTVSELWDGKGEYEFNYFVAGVRQGFEHFAPIVSKGFTAFGEQISAPEREPAEFLTIDPANTPGGDPPNLE